MYSEITSGKVTQHLFSKQSFTDLLLSARLNVDLLSHVTLKLGPVHYSRSQSKWNSFEKPCGHQILTHLKNTLSYFYGRWEINDPLDYFIFCTRENVCALFSIVDSIYSKLHNSPFHFVYSKLKIGLCPVSIFVFYATSPVTSEVSYSSNRIEMVRFKCAVHMYVTHVMYIILYIHVF